MNLYMFIMSLCILSGSLITGMEKPVASFRGDYFTAIPIPHNIKNILADVQQELASCLGSDFSRNDLDNLHITIQVIEGHNQGKMQQALRNVSTPFRQWARGKKWDKEWHFEEKIKKSRIQFGNKGHVKLHVGESALLKQLGKIIEQELDKVGVHTNRNDVAGREYSAHITLGMIPVSRVANAQCNIDFTRKFAHSTFIIDRFVLLQSNRPEPVRRYALHGEYKLNLGQ